MARGTKQGVGNLYSDFKKGDVFSYLTIRGVPKEYLGFLEEWRATPSPVHFVPKPGRYQRNPVTGEVTPVQNMPVPLRKPPQMNEGIWGGEHVIQGFQKRETFRRRVPHFWVPNLKESVVHSKILDKYMSTVITDRTIELIHQHKGFDNYLLETKAYDLASLLALKLKQKILLELKNGCPSFSDRPKKQKEILDEYQHFADEYTVAEIEWYGLSVNEAIAKWDALVAEAAQAKIAPFKHAFRQNIIDQLKNADLSSAEVIQSEDGKTVLERKQNDWLSKINPFAKK